MAGKVAFELEGKLTRRFQCDHRPAADVSGSASRLNLGACFNRGGEGVDVFWF